MNPTRLVLAFGSHSLSRFSFWVSRLCVVIKSGGSVRQNVERSQGQNKKDEGCRRRGEWILDRTPIKQYAYILHSIGINWYFGQADKCSQSTSFVIFLTSLIISMYTFGAEHLLVLRVIKILIEHRCDCDMMLLRTSCLFGQRRWANGCSCALWCNRLQSWVQFNQQW